MSNCARNSKSEVKATQVSLLMQIQAQSGMWPRPSALICLAWRAPRLMQFFATGIYVVGSICQSLVFLASSLQFFSPFFFFDTDVGGLLVSNPLLS